MALTQEYREKEKVQRFTRALGIALYDKKIELSGASLLYFHDADVVLHMIQGYERQAPSKVDQQLVLSLLSLGMLGSVSVLRPHVLEVDRTLRRLPKPANREELDGFRARAKQFLEQRGITSTLERLQNVIELESVLGEQGQVDRFIEILKGASTSTFTAVEQISGIWTQRWNRFHNHGLLDFDHLGVEIDRVFEGRRGRVLEVFGVLQRFRPKYRDQNLRDSLALTMLAGMVEDCGNDPSLPIPRFYTDTEKLNQACFQDDFLRALLRHEPPGSQGAPEDFGLVIRDSAYFLTRARFEELGIGRQSSSTEVEDIERLYVELSSLLAADEQEAISLLLHSGRTWRDKPLADLIDEFETLSLVGSIWVKSRLPDYVTVELEQWTEVFRFAARNETGERLLVQIDSLQSELNAKVHRDWKWTRDFEAVAAATKERKEAIKGTIQDPMRDLGLVRWGYSLSDAAKETLVDSVKAILEAHDDERLVEQAGRMASQLELARTNLDTCLIMGAILWTLGMFERISPLINEVYDHSEQGIVSSLMLLKAASILRARTVSDLNQKKALVDQVLALRGSIASAQRGGYLLGLGYVLYRAWQSEAPSDGVPLERLPQEVSSWADLAFEVGKEAEESLRRKHDLAWAFSVNHCAYVALVTARTRQDIDRYFRMLRDLSGVKAFWNSRFDDTLGCYYLILMEREWEATPADERFRLTFAKRIRRARKHFNDASARDFGDIDLEAHINRLDGLETEWETCQHEAIRLAVSAPSARI